MGSAIRSMATRQVVSVYWKEQILGAGEFDMDKLQGIDNFIFMRRTLEREAAKGSVQLWKANDRLQSACVGAEQTDLQDSGSMRLSIGCGIKQGFFTPFCHSHFEESGDCKVFVLRSEFNGRLIKVNLTEDPKGTGVLDVSDFAQLT